MIVLEVESLAATTATIAWQITFTPHSLIGHLCFPTKAWKQPTEKLNHNPHHTLQIQTVTPQFLFLITFNYKKRHDPILTHEFLFLSLLALKTPPTPHSPLGNRGREREKTGEGRGCSITLFCSTTKPPFSPVNLAHPLGKRKSQKGLHRIARNRDTRNRNRGGTKLQIFAAIPNAPVSDFWSSFSLLNPLLLGAATALGSGNVGETLPYHQHHPILSSSY